MATMSESIIERAARGLCVSMGGDPDHRSTTGGGFQTQVRSDMARPGEGRRQWEDYVPAVRAVLQAIREPSTVMLSSLDGSFQLEVSATHSWKTMIDAALEER